MERENKQLTDHEAKLAAIREKAKEMNALLAELYAGLDWSDSKRCVEAARRNSENVKEWAEIALQIEARSNRDHNR